MINNNHICNFIFCTYCNKPKCIFSKNVFNNNKKLQLKILIKNVIYHYRLSIVYENHLLFGIIYIRQKINCKLS